MNNVIEYKEEMERYKIITGLYTKGIKKMSVISVYLLWQIQHLQTMN